MFYSRVFSTGVPSPQKTLSSWHKSSQDTNPSRCPGVWNHHLCPKWYDTKPEQKKRVPALRLHLLTQNPNPKLWHHFLPQSSVVSWGGQFRGFQGNRNRRIAMESPALPRSRTALEAIGDVFLNKDPASSAFPWQSGDSLSSAQKSKRGRRNMVHYIKVSFQKKKKKSVNSSWHQSS